MAKIRHRTFEIFDLLLEASDALASKSARANTYAIDPSQWEFRQLVTAIRPSGVIHVEFKPKADGEASPRNCRGSDLSRDLTELAELLTNDSRVLVNFEGVLAFDSDAVIRLGEFDSKLRNKGSRIVLCNLEPSVRDSFFSDSAQPQASNHRLR